jgi:hypothetical protein
LFLCTGNSAQSQMAEEYLRHIAGARYEPLSAGTEPKGLNPLPIEVILSIFHQPTDCYHGVEGVCDREQTTHISCLRRGVR